VWTNLTGENRIERDQKVSLSEFDNGAEAELDGRWRKLRRTRGASGSLHVRKWCLADSFSRFAECLLSGVKRTPFHAARHVR
jgi:hypothetical protein